MRGQNIVFLCVAAVFAAIFISGCVKDEEYNNAKRIQIKGSDTMLNLGSAWADAYMKAHPKANITVTDGGSGTGIAALIDGNTDIAQASRKMTNEEILLAKNKGVAPVPHVMGIDALSVIVNKSNPVHRLSISQISDIYSGKINNWRQVGGNNKKILLFTRYKTSGTYAFFLERVVKMNGKRKTYFLSKKTFSQPSNEAIAAMVAKNKGAIGYVGLEFVDKNKVSPISIYNEKSSAFVAPGPENAISGVYPISRPLYWYTNGEPKDDAKSLMDFALSSDGQKIVRKLGFGSRKP